MIFVAICDKSICGFIANRNVIDDKYAEYYFNAWDDADSITDTCDEMANDIANYYSDDNIKPYDNSKSL